MIDYFFSNGKITNLFSIERVFLTFLHNFKPAHAVKMWIIA